MIKMPSKFQKHRHKAVRSTVHTRYHQLMHSDRVHTQKVTKFECRKKVNKSKLRVIRKQYPHLLMTAYRVFPTDLYIHKLQLFCTCSEKWIQTSSECRKSDNG